MKTTKKGNIGAGKVLADLLAKGYDVLQPFGDDLPFDLVTYSEGKFIRIQAKYMGGKCRVIANETGWAGNQGDYHRIYNVNDFDYYGIYYADIDRVIYPHVSFGGCSIAIKLPKSGVDFYWHEDFINFTDNAKKRKLAEFGKKPVWSGKPSMKMRKVEWPSKETLQVEIWSEPTSVLAGRYGVSDVAISKWCKRYGIDKPPRGYWAKQHALKV